MEYLGSSWTYQEGFDDVKQKLLYTTIELETLKMEAIEEMKKHKEDVKRLLNLLKLAYQERDEAKDQLQKLLNKLMPTSPNELHHSILTKSPLIIQTKANSSITESNSLSDTYNNHHSHNSPPVDSFFDAVSSPDFSNINVNSGNLGFMNVNQPFVEDYTGSLSVSTKVDPTDVLIDSLVKGKTLPQKGKLLQAVMEAGPLLQTLLVAGPLPRWRNPPPLQPFKIPPVSIKGCEIATVNQKSAVNMNSVGQKPTNSSLYVEMSRGCYQTCSASMLNFASGVAGSGLSNGQVLSLGTGINSQFPVSKRQRFQ